MAEWEEKLQVMAETTAEQILHPSRSSFMDPSLVKEGVKNKRRKNHS